MVSYYSLLSLRTHIQGTPLLQFRSQLNYYWTGNVNRGNKQEIKCSDLVIASSSGHWLMLATFAMQTRPTTASAKLMLPHLHPVLHTPPVFSSCLFVSRFVIVVWSMLRHQVQAMIVARILPVCYITYTTLQEMWKVRNLYFQLL